MHGLDGNRDDAWLAPNNVSWIRDLLPEQFPSSRIFTYGYNAYTSRDNRIYRQYMFTLAETFISDIVEYRYSTATEGIPIILIAHSLGGILVENVCHSLVWPSAVHVLTVIKALIHSSISREERTSNLKLYTHGVLFFGTPHSGTSDAKYLRIYLKLMSPFKATYEGVLRHLTSDSEFLQEQIHSYVNLALDFQTRFFYETQPLALGPRISGLVSYFR